MINPHLVNNFFVQENIHYVNHNNHFREEIFNKAKDKDGYYHSAISNFKSKNRNNFEIDHIIPISKGGLTEINNLQLITRKENRQKRDN